MCDQPNNAQALRLGCIYTIKCTSLRFKESVAKAAFVTKLDARNGCDMLKKSDVLVIAVPTSSHVHHSLERRSF